MSSPARRRRLEVEHIGDVTVVNFVDRKILDEQNIQIIGEQLFSLVDAEGWRKILLNFSNVEYLSSAALGKLITLNKKTAASAGQADSLQHRRTDLRGVRDHQTRQVLQDHQGRTSRVAGVLIPRQETRRTAPGPARSGPVAGR